MNNKYILLLTAIVFFILGIAVMFFVNTATTTNSIVSPRPTTTVPEATIFPIDPIEDNDEVFCTLDAKICPDGSSVGRSGPNCEFAPCPGE